MRVEEALRKAGFENEIVALDATARSAKEAADSLGVEVAQIVKSLVFVGRESETPILVVASGDNRVDEAKVEAHAGEGVERADAKFVKSRTGFSIGGVPPLAHAEDIKTFVDEDLFRHREVWAAAGHTHAVFALSPDELAKMTGGEVISVKPEAA
ncbi:MAG: YbaK/EbsC family protein [Rubrobacter sp.]|nr:YbaK/EbsC family protein [Rubrobacter sp.]